MKLSYQHTKYACYIGYITQAIVNNLAPLLFVTFQKQFQISIDKIALLIFVNFGVQIIVDLLAAKYADKVGYRPLMIMAHICCTVGIAGFAFFPFVFGRYAYFGLLLSAGINAIGGGLLEVLVSPIVEALPGDQKESAMSLLHSFYCWGQVAVVLLSTVFFQVAGMDSWRILPLLWALVPLFNAVFCSKVPIRSLIEEKERLPLRSLFRVKIFWVFLLMMICAGASELAMSQWASYFAETGLKVTKTMGDLLGPCAFAVLMGIARTIYGLKGSKMNLVLTMAASSTLCVISYLCTVFVPIPVLSLLGCALCGFSVGIMWPGTFSLAAKYYPRGGTAMFAIFALAGDLGCSSGPGLAGIVGNALESLNMGLLVCTAFPLVLILCSIYLFIFSRKNDIMI